MSDPLETRASLTDRLPDAADIAAWDEFVAIYAPILFSDWLNKRGCSQRGREVLSMKTQYLSEEVMIP